MLLTSQIKEFRRDLQNWLNYEPGFIQNEKLKLWMASIGDADTDELLGRCRVGLGALEKPTKFDLLDLEEPKKESRLKNC